MQDPINLKSQNIKETEKKAVTTKKPASRRLVALLIIITLGSIGLAFYFYMQNVKFTRDPQKVAQEETDQLVSRVGELIVLPEGEIPTIATVTDPEKLKDQPFFSKAKNGDKVLIYTNAKKAILYDPTQNKIIEVAPLNIGNQ